MGRLCEQVGDLASRLARGPADTDEGGGGGAGPVSVAEQVQAGFVRCAGAGGGDVAASAAQSERCEVGEGRAEAGAPDDRVGLGAGAVGPFDAAGDEADPKQSTLVAARRTPARSSAPLRLRCFCHCHCHCHCPTSETDSGCSPSNADAK